jgi:CRISPR-associated endonuclease/helicase Cas3
MSNLPSFTDFYAAVHNGRSPFPWQAALADEVLQHGWPDLLDLPTGSGKTTAFEIALYCLACRPDHHPRRSVMVVDRRIVVDQGADHARSLQRQLQGAKDGPMRQVADALRALWNGAPGAAPFAVAVMRGGMPLDNDWARRPDQPLLGVSTVDQLGSRLLFRGYGVGKRSVSIHAGLIGNDTLLLLDEVHLSIPFAQTVASLQHFARQAEPVLPQRFEVVHMSATPVASQSSNRRYTLGVADWEHPVLGTRLQASKLAQLVEVNVTGQDEAKKRQALAEHAVADALSLQAKGAVVVAVVVNRVDTARLVAGLVKDLAGTDVLLVTGRMRALDRDHLVQTQLLPRAGAGRDRKTAQPLVVVATQCIEAGADLDFDALVTECASLDALRQRFGRVDRRGELGDSRSHILVRSDQLGEGEIDPVYGEALASTWQWLRGLAKKDVVDFGVRSQGQQSPPVEVVAPLRCAPVLMPWHLDAWSQTAPQPANDPDVALWLHGPQSKAADVQVVWRVDVVPQVGADAALIERLLMCRPSALEAISVPLAAARRWLSGESPVAIADVVAGGEEPEYPGGRSSRASESQEPVALRWSGDDSRWVTADELRPGDVLVVDVNRGGISSGSFDPDSEVSVQELGDLAQLRGRGVASLRLSLAAMQVWQLPEGVMASMPRPVDLDEAVADSKQRVLEWLGQWDPEVMPEALGSGAERRALLRALSSSRMRIDIHNGEFWLRAPVVRDAAQREPEVADCLTEDDDSSFRQAEVTLSAHSEGVRDLALQFGRRLGFPESVVEDLGLAAWCHDVGKADPRFQRWLVGGSEVSLALLDAPLAKSSLPAEDPTRRRLARLRAGYPPGYRHELLSLAMIEANPDALSQAHDRDLVLHLVSSHHGWCRPFPPAVDDAEDLVVRLQHGDATLAASTRHRLARLDSGVGDRFWQLTQRYGWWGLAWLEAVLRLADHRRSQFESEGQL